MRRAKLFVATAMILQVTALFLVWWVISASSQGISTEYGTAALWGQDGEVAHEAAVWATTLLAAAPVPILFVRLAAASWRHEPPAWRRDLAISFCLVLAGLASTMFWPKEFPFFWGGATWPGNATVEEVSFSGLPGLGWWVSFTAALLLALALWMSRGETHGTADEAPATDK